MYKAPDGSEIRSRINGLAAKGMGVKRQLVLR